MLDLAYATHCLQTLDVGVAIVDAETSTVLFENARFFQWFPPPPEGGDNLWSRLHGFDVAPRVQARLAEGRPFVWETEVRAGGRAVSLGVQIRAARVAGRSLVIVECANVSKQKEAEYMLDSYSKMAEKNARALQKEKERVEKLLLNIMPRSVYEEMKDYGSTTPQRFESASVLMLDFVGFTEMAVSRDPSSLIAELNDIFSAFDRIAELFGCERIKTIGDAYVAVAGVPEPNVDHAGSIAKVALRMRRYLERRNASHPVQWRCRIGIATGPLIGSLVGIQKYVYDIFGPAVNLAARMESLCEPMQILLPADMQRTIRDEFVFEERGDVDVKGFGTLRLYALVEDAQLRR
jgi:class 3 adenylate cyclase